MSKKKPASFWMTPDILDLLKSEAERTGVSQARILETALLQHLDLPEDEARRRLEANQREIDRLLTERERLRALLNNS